MLRRLFLILLTYFVVSDVYCQMPIIAYMGVPNDKSSEKNFKDFADCGFNVSLYGYSSLSQMIAATRISQKYGVKILGHCPETHHTPEKAAALLKNNPGFFGYVLQDEPSAQQIDKLQKEIKSLKTVDSSHCFYINMFPYYGDWILKHTKTKNYADYIKKAFSTDCMQMSFDFYPITRKGMRDTWYWNLEKIRNESLKTQKPFWGFVLSTPHDDYPSPTIGSLRLQVYSNLAYGAQAIQYFTYWTPEANIDGHDYHDGPIDNAGNKTKTYALVQSMNKELKQIAPLFYNGEVVSVHHLGKNIPVGTTRMKGLPVNLSSLKIVNKKGCILSTIKYENHLYLCVVNKDYKESISLLLSAKNNIPVKIEKNLTTQPLQNKYSIEPGDIAIFKLN